MARKRITVQLVYMTASLVGLENVDAADEFESVDDLTRRANLASLEMTLNKAVIYYQHFVDARESGRIMITQPYDSPNSFILNDDSSEYHEVERLVMQVDSEILEAETRRAGLESIDELLKRSLILFEPAEERRRECTRGETHLGEDQPDLATGDHCDAHQSLPHREPERRVAGDELAEDADREQRAPERQCLGVAHRAEIDRRAH